MCPVAASMAQPIKLFLEMLLMLPKPIAAIAANNPSEIIASGIVKSIIVFSFNVFSFNVFPFNERGFPGVAS